MRTLFDLILADIVSWAAIGLLSLCCGYFWHKVKAIKLEIKHEREKQAAVQDGVLKVLRASIIAKCKYYQNQREVSIETLDSIRDLYGIYHSLGGNGLVTKLWEQLLLRCTSIQGLGENRNENNTKISY